MFDRETRRAKVLEARGRAKRDARGKSAAGDVRLPDHSIEGERDMILCAFRKAPRTTSPAKRDCKKWIRSRKPRKTSGGSSKKKNEDENEKRPRLVNFSFDHPSSLCLPSLSGRRRWGHGSSGTRSEHVRSTHGIKALFQSPPKHFSLHFFSNKTDQWVLFLIIQLLFVEESNETTTRRLERRIKTQLYKERRID